ncbi:MAG: hypothetical protein WCD18_11530, partial [Thermosynechococcaceae cyanobacterium]
MLNLRTKPKPETNGNGDLTATDLLTGKQTRNNIPILIMGTLGFQALNAFFLLALLLGVVAIALKPAPTLVQLVDGKPIRVTAKDSLSREPESIKRFAKDVTALMFSMTGTLPPENFDQARLPKPDPGITIGSQNLKIATASFQAGFALSEDFRRPFLESLADITPQALFGNKNQDPTKPATQVVPIIKLISEPKQTETGLWKFNVVANLLLFNTQDPLGQEVIPFNKEITIRAVEPPQKLTGNTPLERTIYGIR